jgi:hypothetical protein
VEIEAIRTVVESPVNVAIMSGLRQVRCEGWKGSCSARRTGASSSFLSRCCSDPWRWRLTLPWSSVSGGGVRSLYRALSIRDGRASLLSPHFSVQPQRT